jgi:hypothetical protein
MSEFTVEPMPARTAKIAGQIAARGFERYRKVYGPEDTLKLADQLLDAAIDEAGIVEIDDLPTVPDPILQA